MLRNIERSARSCSKHNSKSIEKEQTNRLDMSKTVADVFEAMPHAVFLYNSWWIGSRVSLRTEKSVSFLR